MTFGLSKFFKMKASKEKKIFALKLRHYNYCLEKKWYIEYHTFNKDGEKIKRKYRGEINHYNTKEQRLQAIEEILDYIKKFNDVPPKRPGSRKVQMYNDEQQYYKVVEEYLTSLKYRLRKKSFQTYQSVFRDFLNFIHRNNINELKKFSEDLANYYINSMDKSASTKNKTIVILKTFFNFLIEKNYLKNNPFKKIKKFKNSTIPPAAFKPKQRKELKEEIARKHPQLWLFCMFIFYTFIRPGELRKLKIENIWFEEEKIEIPANISKNGKNQFVQIPRQLIELIKKYKLVQYPQKNYIFGNNFEPGMEPRGVNYFSNTFKSYLKKLNYSSRYVLYSWKHSGATECALSGIPLKELQLQLRHSNLLTTDMYLKSIGIFDTHNIKNKFPDL